MPQQLAERHVAVVTGGGRGIGAALARGLARRGAQVAVWDVDAAAAEAVAAALPGEGHRAWAVDVADAEAVTRAASEVGDALGDARTVLLNAGVYAQGDLADLPLDDLRWVVGVNLWGVLHGARAFLPALRRASPARLGVVLSGLAFAGLPGKGAYALTKAASQAVATTLRAELHGTGVTVTAIYPPVVDTGLVRTARAVDPARRDAEVAAVTPLAWPADTVAERALRGLEQGRMRVLMGREARGLDLMARLAPGHLPDWLGRWRDRLP